MNDLNRKRVTSLSEEDFFRNETYEYCMYGSVWSDKFIVRLLHSQKENALQRHSAHRGIFAEFDLPNRDRREISKYIRSSQKLSSLTVLDDCREIESIGRLIYSICGDKLLNNMTESALNALIVAALISGMSPLEIRKEIFRSKPSSIISMVTTTDCDLHKKVLFGDVSLTAYARLDHLSYFYSYFVNEIGLSKMIEYCTVFKSRELSDDAEKPVRQLVRGVKSIKNSDYPIEWMVELS